MRTWITDTTRDLLDDPPPGGPVTLDEISACAGITIHHLRAYYGSVDAVITDLTAGASIAARSRRC
ncbi:hypothetical protein [Amycolatopsis sp. NBC_00438]|uniref:hypothetical protein n=1 Tax=Amycolatopsis sp. NBC_00438 TaxID=2903558 RepID=UPI002E238D28